MEISIVIPLFNEQESVKPLCVRIVDAMSTSGYQFEALLVDDGSTDETWDRAVEVVQDDNRFTAVKLSRNFGQTAALAAGFDLSKGRIIVSLDGDLQNDPSDIERLVTKIEEGYDIVAGWRERRQDRFVTRKIPSRVANWLIRNTTRLPIHDTGCGLRAYRAEVVKKLPLYSEMHRLLPIITGLIGARIGETPVRHHPRQFGVSKYGISRIYKLIMDFTAIRVIMSLFRLPMFGFGILAIPFIALSMLGFVFSVIEVILYPEEPLVVYVGLSILSAAFSAFLIMMGILCELVYKTGNVRIESLLNVSATSNH